MKKYKILVVEDDDNILELLNYHLQKGGFQVSGAACGEEAMRMVRLEGPDLILLDLMLPGIDGLDLCRILKQDKRTADIPIIMLTAKGEEADILAGLELGADDYITKPFSTRVLLARIRAVLRRRITHDQEMTAAIQAQNLLIHPGRREVFVDGAPVDLTFTEFNLLYLLASKPGWVFNRYQIVDAVRGDDASVTERSVDVHIVGLRRKLGNAGTYIETVRGVGYRFKDA